jgi:raffinose/stachyose/melibiose transport system substrate-binding protein
VTFTIDGYPGGADGDNLVKTKLATGDMDDIFFYNSGALLVALNPAQTLVDLSTQPFMANLDNAYKQSVSVGTAVFGVPNGVAAAGGILYNKKVFAKVGISVPKTWADFEANNDKIKAAGIAPVLETYGDTWTSQLFVLADEYNVQAADPTYAADYTANKVKIASNPLAMAGFSYLAEGFKKGWYEKDFQTMKYTQGLKALADGTAAQFPMLTQVVPTIVTQTPDEAKDIGFFALPGTDAAKNGATVWMPNSLYIAKTSKNIPAAEDFLAFVATPAAADALTAAVPPSGPYMIKGATLPSTVLPVVNDLAAYINSGNDAPALEFVSPLKGPSLENICIAVGTGQMTAAAGAAAYDQDVAKQAKQLGLPGW